MYDDLAPVYDLFQAHDWTRWADFICAIDQQFSLRKGRGDGSCGRPILLDLGCGTGGFCLEMAKRGYDPIGIDRSLPMLNQAQKKASEQRMETHQADCLFLEQDITSFELFGTVDLIVCLMDTVNHLLTDEQIRNLFQLCAHYLNPGCLMVFDVLTYDHLSKVLGDQFFFDDQPDYTVFWQNNFDAQTGISQSQVTLFSREAEQTYSRYDETIQERYLSDSAISALVADTLFERIQSKELQSLQPPRNPDERIFYILRKPC